MFDKRAALIPAGLIVAALLGNTAAQEKAKTPKQQAKEGREHYNSPEDIAQGQRLVLAYCSRCHGKDGTGGKGPDLTRGVFRHGSSDEAVFRNIQDGIRGTGMPGWKLPDEWAWQIISYLRSRSQPSEEEKLTGDPEKGKQLFLQQKCDTCHWTGSGGGRRGTDLSRLRATPDHVRKAIMDPAREVDALYQPLVIVMQDGVVRTGMRLYESTYYVLLIDEQDNLQTIPKSQIEELQKPTESLMPSYAKELTAEQLEHLVAYVFSLQKGPPK